MNPFGILDFQPPQPIRAINDEIHFHPGTSSPVEHFPFDAGVSNPIAQMPAGGHGNEVSPAILQFIGKDELMPARGMAARLVWEFGAGTL
jgi:hypothetical protein